MQTNKELLNELFDKGNIYLNKYINKLGFFSDGSEIPSEHTNRLSLTEDAIQTTLQRYSVMGGFSAL